MKLDHVMTIGDSIAAGYIDGGAENDKPWPALAGIRFRAAIHDPAATKFKPVFVGPLWPTLQCWYDTGFPAEKRVPINPLPLLRGSPR